ncbi:MAG: S8 family serine peptidase [Bacillota bacterium]
MRPPLAVPSLLILAALAGCTDAAGPGSSGAPLAATSAETPNPTGRQIVEFSGAAPVDFASRVRALGGSVVWSSGAAGLAAVSGLSSTGAATLARSPGIKSLTNDMVISLEAPSGETVADAGTAGIASQANPAASILYPRQWNMRAVHADQAWAAGVLGSSTVSVYVLDTGIDYGYFDLQTLVDLGHSTDLLGTFDVNGVSFTEADTVEKYFPGRNPVADLHTHGTVVANAISSRGFILAGVTSHTTLVAVKVCSYLDICPLSSVLAGVIYAADNGADVVNLSLSSAFSKAGSGRTVGLINRTFSYAQSKGTTIVVAAGNDALDMDHDRSGYVTYCNTPAVICVDATGPTAEASVNGPWTDIDASSTFTNFGSSAVDLAAPGGNGGSFVFGGCSATSLILPICQTGIFVVGVQGTSASAPHVAGAAAMLVAQLGRNPAAIRARLLQTADDLGQSGTDPYYGKGRLNVARAVGAIE